MINLTRGTNPIWFLVDLAANAFDDNFYMYVLENDIPYQYEDIYQDINGTLRANPVQFLANGTLPIDVFFDDSKLYRLEFRQNDGVNPPSQSDPLIYLVENYSPLGVIPNDAEVDSSLVTNQLTNPQFVDYNFENTFTLSSVSNPDPIEIGPGWFLNLQGTGSLTLQRIALDSTTQTPTNAPYALRINLSGSWTSAYLSQILDENGVLWSERFVSGAFTARMDGTLQTVSMRLDDSQGAPLGTMVSSQLLNTFQQYSGNVELPETTNTDSPPDAYIECKVILPSTGDIYITSLSVVPTAGDVTVPFGQETVNRQIDHTFNHYKPLLEYKPIPSHLIGWDFPVNPAQWGEAFDGVSDGNTGANTSNYVWDQTIVFQSIDSGFDASRSTLGGLQLTALQDGELALIQYLEADKAIEILTNRMSVNLAINKSTGSASNAQVRLYYTDDVTLPDMTANDSLVSAVAADGTPTIGNGSWVEIERTGLDTAEFTLENFTDNTYTEYGYHGWDPEGVAGVATAKFFAIVVSFATLTTNDVIDIQSISLVSGDIPTIPAPKTYSETLSDCERYYEQSYESGVAAETVTEDGAEIATQQSSYNSAGASFSFYNSGFFTKFRTEKYSPTPTVVYYSPSAGTAARVDAHIWGPGAAGITVTPIVYATWYDPTVSSKGVYNDPQGDPTTIGVTVASLTVQIGMGWISYHYTADSRLGIV